MASVCPRCGGELDPEGICAACAFAGILDEPVASAAPLALEEAAERIAQRRRLVELAPVGRGGMGFVFRARQVQLDREVALKLFTSGSHERFEREAKLLASLSHPHIVAIHDFGSEDGTPYIVMEYMDGPSVRTLIDMGGMSRARALEILEQVARAIEYAHARGVIHRDIKPENVLTNVDGIVKVGDFGIARLANQEGDPGAGSGTPAYMAPERRHIPGAADERSDIYSLGALAREMLEGAGPLDATLEEFIRRAMEPDPDRRFQTATEFLEALRDVGAHPRALPPRLSTRDRIRRLTLSKLFWFFLASSLVEVLVLFVWVTVSAPVNLGDLFEAYLQGNSAATTRQLNSPSEIPTNEIDALVAREIHSSDIRRAALAFEFAHARNRQVSIPADLRLRIYRSAPANLYTWWHGSSIWEPSQRPYLLQSILRDGGPELGRRLMEELASPDAQDIPLLIVGIAWTADGPLCLELRRRLLADPRPAHSRPLLLALAARLDIPLPAHESVISIYERFLPDLLDPSGEAIWEVAARLALELPKGDDVERWRTEFLPRRGGPLTPENLAAGREIPWPWEGPGYVRSTEGSIRHNSWRKNSEYLAAVMTRWQQTQRFTLPHYPYDHDTDAYAKLGERIDLSRALRRGRFNAAARAILLPGPAMSWECAYLHINTLAGRPEVKAHGRGRGDVKFTGDFETAINQTPVRLSIGIGPLVPRTKRPTLPGTVTMQGSFSIQEQGTLRFDGTSTSRDPFGGGSGSANGLAAAGETMVVHCNVFGFHGPHSRSGYAWLMFPDSSPGTDFESRWRSGIRAAAERLAGAELGYTQKFDVGKLMTFAMNTPVPEAVPGLRRLWDRRNEFEPNDPILPPLKHGDAIAAALLMAGDPTPLKDEGLVGRMPQNVASRIFLFSPSSDVRAALAEQAAQPMGPGDAEAVARVLSARGDTSSPLAREAAKGIAQGRINLMIEIAPFAGVMGLLLVFGWFPRNRGHLPGVAASLAYTGILLRLLKLQVGEVLWIPVAGDLLLMISAFLYGSLALKLLTTGMMVSSLLQLMMPGARVPEIASYVLLCAYLAVMSLDALSRRLPEPYPRRFGLAFLLMWWLLIVPCLFLTIASALNWTPVLSVQSDPGAFLLAAATVLPPLVLFHYERVRRLRAITFLLP